MMLCEVASVFLASVQIWALPGTETSGTQTAHCVLSVVTSTEAGHFLRTV